MCLPLITLTQISLRCFCLKTKTQLHFSPSLTGYSDGSHITTVFSFFSILIIVRIGYVFILFLLYYIIYVIDIRYLCRSCLSTTLFVPRKMFFQFSVPLQCNTCVIITPSTVLVSILLNGSIITLKSCSFLFSGDK